MKFGIAVRACAAVLATAGPAVACESPLPMPPEEEMARTIGFIATVSRIELRPEYRDGLDGGIAEITLTPTASLRGSLPDDVRTGTYYGDYFMQVQCGRKRRFELELVDAPVGTQVIVIGLKRGPVVEILDGAEMGTERAGAIRSRIEALPLRP